MTRLLPLAALLLAAAAGPANDSTPLFREAAAEVGLRFRHFTGSTGEYFMPEIMGAGAALLDYDRDGDLDVFLIQGTTLDPGASPGDSLSPPPAGQPAGHRLFRNDLDAAAAPPVPLGFTDVSEAAGLAHVGYGMGVATGDYDNDGYPDLYVTAFGSNRLYHNDGNGSFSDVTQAAGVDDPRWSTSAAFLDYDRDGDLDLFVANYLDFTVAGNKTCFEAAGARDYCTPAIYRAVPDRLFRNEGDGRFSDVTETAGIARAFGPGLGVASADFDGDGWVDIYVANDGAPNQLWINQRDGSFADDGLFSGTAYNAAGLPQGSMGLAVGDFDGDGDENILVTHLPGETNTLYVNDGEGRFEDSTMAWGLGTLGFRHTGFGTDWIDYDNDGWLDLFVANGAVNLIQARRGEPRPFAEPNLLLRNPGRPPFEDVSELAGPALQLAEVSRGAAFGDVDEDGDVDVLVTNNEGPVRLLLNQAGAGSHWMKLRLRGVEDNGDGIGARVALVRDGARTLWRRAHSDGSYLSASDVRVHFGLGDRAEVERVLVVWPSGARESWSGLAVDRVHELLQGSGEPWKGALP